MRTAALLVAVVFAAIVLDAPGATQAGGGDEAAPAPVFAPVPTPGPSVDAGRPAPVQPIFDHPVPLRSVSPAPRRAVRQVPHAAVAVSGAASSLEGVRGTASWYCGHGSACPRGYPGGLYAAAGPALRVGDWRGRYVVVAAMGQRVRVRLVDWCACPSRALDLFADAFSRLAPLSRGLVKVKVSW